MSKFFSGVKGTNYSLSSTGGLSNSAALLSSYTTKGVYTGISGGTNAGIELVADTASNLSFIDFSYTTVDYRGRIMYNHSANSLAFYTSANATAALNIDSSGNLIAGVADMHSTRFMTGMYGTNTATPTPSSAIFQTVNIAPVSNTEITSTISLVGKFNTLAGDYAGAYISGGTYYLNGDVLAFGLWSGGSRSEKMRLYGNNFGIGTTNPQSALHITSDVYDGIPTTTGIQMGLASGNSDWGNYAVIKLSAGTSTTEGGVLEFTYPGASFPGYLAYSHSLKTFSFAPTGGTGFIAQLGNTDINFYKNTTFATGTSVTLGLVNTITPLLVRGTITASNTITGPSDSTNSFYAGNCTSGSYNMVLRAANDVGGDKLVIYVNGSARVDGASPANSAVIRNEGGTLVLGHGSYEVDMECTRVNIRNGLKVLGEAGFSSGITATYLYDGDGQGSTLTTPTVVAQFVGNTQASGYFASSDLRLKKNIKPISKDFLDTILKKINPVSYNFIDIRNGSNIHYGLIAQEVEEICSDFISKDHGELPNIMSIGTKYIDGIKHKFKISGEHFHLIEKGKELSTYITKLEDMTKETHVVSKVLNVSIDVESSDLIVEIDKSFEKIFVYGTYENDVRSINYESFVPLLIKDSQVKSEKINELNDEIIKLKGAISELQENNDSAAQAMSYLAKEIDLIKKSVRY